MLTKILSTSLTLTYLIFTTTYKVDSCYHPHFGEEETETREVHDLPKVTQHAGGRGRT